MQNVPLGSSNPSRVPCPPATSMAPTRPSFKASDPRCRASFGREAVGRIAEAECGRLRRPVRQGADLSRPVRLAVEPADQVKIDSSNLPGQSFPLRLIKMVPELCQVLLPVGGERGEKVFWGGHHTGTGHYPRRLCFSITWLLNKLCDL